MSDMLYGVGGALLTGALFLIANSIRTASSLPRRVVRLEEISALSIETLEAQTEGLIAIAEAVSGKRCNGNVEDAINTLQGNKKKTREFLASRVAGGR